MANKEIIWSLRAQNELKDILDFFTQRNGNPNYSLKILSEVEDLATTLSKSEFIGRLTSNRITRVIPMEDYLIFYEFNKNRIEIISFWDNRQSPKKDLFSSRITLFTYQSLYFLLLIMRKLETFT